MRELYRKWGRSLRREGDRLVRLDEAGEAIDDGHVFRAQPIEERVDLMWPDDNAVDGAAHEIASIVRPPLVLERLFVSEANLAHECNGVRWNETLRRVHIAVARPPIRALIDLGDFRFDLVRRVTEALKRAGGEREAPKRIRIAENVGAALLPFLGIDRRQTAAAHDGKGRPIDDCAVTPKRPPNWFRPSYRLKARRAWFHLRAEPFGELEPAPAAIALLGPVGERVHLLCADGADVFPVAIAPARRPPLAARPTSTWYPYAAGTFGAELML